MKMNKRLTNIVTTGAIAGLLPLGACGCFTTEFDHTASSKDYYNAPSTFTPFKVSGAQKILFEAAPGQTVAMEINNTLPPKAQYAVPESPFEKIMPGVVSTLGTLGGIAIGGAVVNSALGTLTEKTIVPTQIVRPEIVRPEVVKPEVVSPEIVEVPAV